MPTLLQKGSAMKTIQRVILKSDDEMKPVMLLLVDMVEKIRRLEKPNPVTIEFDCVLSEVNASIIQLINRISVSLNDNVLADKADMLVNLYHKWLENTYSTLDDWLEEWLRVDTNSGLPMNNGWVFGGGIAYFEIESEAESYCQEHYGCSIDALHSDNSDEVYWTDWQV